LEDFLEDLRDAFFFFPPSSTANLREPFLEDLLDGLREVFFFPPSSTASLREPFLEDFLEDLREVFLFPPSSAASLREPFLEDLREPFLDTVFTLLFLPPF
jgi:hypothetical protein